MHIFVYCHFLVHVGVHPATVTYTSVTKSSRPICFETECISFYPFYIALPLHVYECIHVTHTGWYGRVAIKLANTKIISMGHIAPKDHESVKETVDKSSIKHEVNFDMNVNN